MHRPGDDPVGLIERILQSAAAFGFVHRALHRGRDAVRIQHDHAVLVSGGAADGLDERGFRPEKALLVRIENGNERHLRDVEALTQQVDADQHIVHTEAQVAHQLLPLDGLNVVVHIAHLDAGGFEVIGQILRHLLGERGNEHPFSLRRAGVYLADEIVDLPIYRTDNDLRIEQTGRADDLLDHLTGARQLILGRRCRNVHDLVQTVVELVKIERAVVIGTRQAESVLDQTFLAGAVAVIHGTHLRQRHMALVHDEQKILGKVVDERVRRTSRLTPRQHARIVLNARAEADLLKHFNVVARALRDALGLYQLAVLLEVFHAQLELFLKVLDGLLQLFLGRDIMARRKNGNVTQFTERNAGQRVNTADAVHLITEELHADNVLVRVYRPDLHRVAAHAEAVALERNVVALILNIYQSADELLAAHLHARSDGNDHALVVDRVAERVDARNRGHDDNIAPFAQRRGRRVAQTVDLIVDGGILLDIGVGRGDIRLRLVVIVVRYEIFYRILRKKFAQLGAELCGQRFIVREHQRRALGLLDDIRHSERFARTGNTHQSLLGQAVVDALHQLRDRLRLVARHFVRAVYLKLRQGNKPPSLLLSREFQYLFRRFPLLSLPIDVKSLRATTQ